MPRKAKRRPVRRRPVDRSEELSTQRRWIDNAARGLVENRTPEQLRSELYDRQLLLDEADRAAQMDPSPPNLARYRAARSDLEIVQRAVELAEA